MHTLCGYPNQQSEFKSKVSAKGLEPLTNGLKGRCSTIELRAHLWDGMILSRPRTRVNKKHQHKKHRQESLPPVLISILYFLIPYYLFMLPILVSRVSFLTLFDKFVHSCQEHIYIAHLRFTHCGNSVADVFELAIAIGNAHALGLQEFIECADIPIEAISHGHHGLRAICCFGNGSMPC